MAEGLRGRHYYDGRWGLYCGCDPQRARIFPLVQILCACGEFMSSATSRDEADATLFDHHILCHLQNGADSGTLGGNS